MLTARHYISARTQTSAALTKESISQEILDDALNKIAQLTGLSISESQTLLTQQLLSKTHSSNKNEENSQVYFQNTQMRNMGAILDRNEVNFISNLFH
jgi:hypothetical protein